MPARAYYAAMDGPKLLLPTIATLLLGGCAQSVSGVVLDAATDQPLAGATVELSDVGWGNRDGQIVWDAEKLSRATTDGEGRFAFDRDGGVRLRVRAPHAMSVETSLCARSPMLVRVGGPFPGLRADRRLLLGAGANSPNDTAAAEIGLSGSPVSSGESRIRFQAKGGLRFVEGTGSIPRPPSLPYPQTADIDLGSGCGWLFVGNGSAPIAVIQIGGFGWEQDPGGPRRLVLLYVPLPKG